MKMMGNLCGVAAAARVFLWLLLPAVAVGMQLPPDIQADRYLLQAERAIQEQDFVGAKAAMDEILELQAQHDLALPDEFFFRYAEVLARLDLHDEAIETVTEYLTLVGRDGEHYREALELLTDAEAAKAATEAAAEAVADAASRQPGDVRTFDGMEFVWVPSGEFRLGSVSPEAENSERPVTQVRVSRGFWLGKYEVTQAEWQAVMGTIPSTNSGCGRCPVETVSWYETKEFIRSLNERAEGTPYRLPTEAEWEYAARAGTIRDRYLEDLDAIAWCDGGSRQPVGQKVPNAWGLYDMLGNVWEWVEDWRGDYPGGTVADPQGPSFGSTRVFRGGGWSPSMCRASGRGDNSPGERGDVLGFRLLRTE